MSFRIRFRGRLFVWLALLLPLTTLLSNRSTAVSAASFTFTPIADAYVDSSNPSANYGSSTQLRVDGSPILNSYLKFSVTGLSGTVTQATLQVYANSSSSGGYSVHGVSNTTWSESSITYSNAPPMGSGLSTSGSFNSNVWTSVNVTGWVTGNGTFSLGLTDNNSTAISLASRESGPHAPQLILQVASSTPTNTPTGAFSPTATRTATATLLATPTNTPLVATPTTTSTNAPTNTPTRTPTQTPTPTSSSGSPVIVAAGDIACDPADSNFNGGKGTLNACRMLYTSNLIAAINPAAVLDLGDNQYYCGGYNAFLQSYASSWGRFLKVTHPSVGNHEYLTSGGTDCDSTGKAAGYFKYFGAAAGSPSQGYYSYNVGSWHLIALNTQCSQVGGCGSGSPQETWLRSDLAAHPSTCTLAYWHIPLWSSGGRASSNSKTFVQDLYSANAEVVLTGHDHDYERFAPQNPQGQMDLARGIREFVAGTGGSNHTSFTTIFPNSQVRNDKTFGVLKLTLHASSYDWQFVPEAGATFTDSGTTACH